MEEELLDVLMRLESRITEALGSLDSRLMSVESKIASLDTNVAALRDDTISHFDGVYMRFDRLESEHQALSAAVKRIEEQHESEN